MTERRWTRSAPVLLAVLLVLGSWSSPGAGAAEPPGWGLNPDWNLSEAQLRAQLGPPTAEQHRRQRGYEPKTVQSTLAYRSDRPDWPGWRIYQFDAKGFLIRVRWQLKVFSDRDGSTGPQRPYAAGPDRNPAAEEQPGPPNQLTEPLRQIMAAGRTMRDASPEKAGQPNPAEFRRKVLDGDRPIVRAWESGRAEPGHPGRGTWEGHYRAAWAQDGTRYRIFYFVHQPGRGRGAHDRSSAWLELDMIRDESRPRDPSEPSLDALVPEMTHRSLVLLNPQSPSELGRNFSWSKARDGESRQHYLTGPEALYESLADPDYFRKKAEAHWAGERVAPPAPELESSPSGNNLGLHFTSPESDPAPGASPWAAWLILDPRLTLTQLQARNLGPAEAAPQPAASLSYQPQFAGRTAALTYTFQPAGPLSALDFNLPATTGDRPAIRRLAAELAAHLARTLKGQPKISHQAEGSGRGCYSLTWESRDWQARMIFQESDLSPSRPLSGEIHLRALANNGPEILPNENQPGSRSLNLTEFLKEMRSGAEQSAR